MHAPQLLGNIAKCEKIETPENNNYNAMIVTESLKRIKWSFPEEIEIIDSSKLLLKTGKNAMSTSLSIKGLFKQFLMSKKRSIVYVPGLPLSCFHVRHFIGQSPKESLQTQLQLRAVSVGHISYPCTESLCLGG